MQSGFSSTAYPFARRPRSGPSMVSLLIIANVAVFILQEIATRVHPELFHLLALSREGIAESRYWQLVTYMFLHGGALHLLVNMLGLYFAGREVESLCGPKHLLGIYFAGGILGGAAQLIAGPATIEIVGASGGVCAVLLAFSTLLPELEITALIFFVIPLRMKAKWLGRAVIATSVVFQLFATGHDPVAHVAHLGGALAGWFYTRRLGYGSPFFLQSWFRDRQRSRRRLEAMSSTEFISEEIDPILDKIAREGIHSLTRSERRALERGRDKIANRTK